MWRILYNKTVSEQRIQTYFFSANDKWCQTILVVDSGLTNSAQLFSFELSIPVRNAYVKHTFLNYELLQEKGTQ
jgi:hypothetical protein